MSTVSTFRNCCFLLIFSLATLSSGYSQSALDTYTSAVRQTRIENRMAAMEQFLAANPNSNLRRDALEVLVWDALESGHRDRAQAHAEELLQVDSQNALALGVIAETEAETRGRTDRKVALQAFRMAKDGIRSYPSLRHPEGMSEGEFMLLQRQLVAILDGEAGLGYLTEKDYDTARSYLHASVAIRPLDPRYLYGLALALIDGKNPNVLEGYIYLARVVNLTQGSAAGAQIAEFAQHKFEKAGGSAAGWNQYLAAAVVPGMPAQQPLLQNTPQQPATTLASAAPANEPDDRGEAPSEIPAPAFKREYVARNAPVSMGILLQTEHLNKENRKQILDALTDMVRHLRNDDEVFIMAYGKKLDFEQDLTGNPKLLEDAMNQIKPEAGSALLDSVAFAAGHLERIATNKNRLLLVISDGRNSASKDNPLALSQKLNTVRVDCIGLDVDGDPGRRQLESLAAYSGGQVTFANDASQLRNAAVQMAEGIGIEFPN
jgi:tetratricopeptide (TPR) repeat protein